MPVVRNTLPLSTSHRKSLMYARFVNVVCIAELALHLPGIQVVLPNQAFKIGKRRARIE